MSERTERVERRDQRRYPRLRCAGTAEVIFSFDAEPCPARIADLSVEGCRLILLKPEELENNDRIELTFTVNQLPFRVLGQVKAVRSPTEFGLHFPQLGKTARGRLCDLIEELQEAKNKSGLELKSATKAAAR